MMLLSCTVEASLLLPFYFLLVYGHVRKYIQLKEVINWFIFEIMDQNSLNGNPYEVSGNIWFPPTYIVDV